MGDLSEIDARQLLDELGDAIVIADDRAQIVYVNAAACGLLAADEQQLVGAPLSSIVPERLRAGHAEGFRRYVETGEAVLVGSRPVRLPALRADGSEVEVDLALSAHRGKGGELLLVGALRDIADRVELERQRDIARYLSTSREVTTRLALGADAATLGEAAPMLLEVLGDGLRWDGGAAWEVREGELHPVATWAQGSDEIAVTMTAGITFAIGEGVPGRVVETGEPVWLETITSSTIFVRQDRARQAGVRSCFGFPIVVAGEIIGVVEMYSTSRQPPEPELLGILQAAGIEIGRFLERAQARRHLVEMAEALQASLLPPHPPMIPGIDVAVRYRAAAGVGQVGGDFFDVFPLPDGEWAVLIGDVSGRGPRAAALTALARYTLRAAAIGAPSPSGVLRVLNDVVRRELETAYEGDERFLTVAYLTISPEETGYRVKVACGGHPYPLARRGDGSVDEIRCDGELIGAFEAHESVDESITIQAGDCVVLVTDGVIEARSGSDQFGEDRLRQVISEAPGDSASSIADSIEAAVLDHLGGHGQDDAAIVVLRLPLDAATGAAIDVRVGDISG